MKPFRIATIFCLIAGLAPSVPAQETPESELSSRDRVQALVDAPTPPLIEFVDVRGTRSMARQGVLTNFTSVQGTFLNPDVISRDIRALYGTGYFSDVWVEAEAGEEEGTVVLVVHVEEKPRIGSIEYTGLKSVTESDLNDRFAEIGILIQRELGYDPAMVRRAEVAIQQMLQVVGRQNAQVTSETFELMSNRVGIEFIVDEGPKIKIEEIEIVGNEVFTDAEIRAAMRWIKETGPIVAFRNQDLFHEEKLLDDVYNGIGTLFQEHGYMRGNVDFEVEVRPHQVARTLPFIKPSFPWGIPLPFWKKEVDRYFITLRVEENEQYSVGTVQVRGNERVFDDAILAAVGLRSGEVFNFSALRQGFEALIDVYGRQGYINFSPSPLLDYDDVNHVVNVVLDIDEGEQYIVDEINFRGNTTTRDNVIRREFLLTEGQPFDSQALELSILRVNQLDYFEPIAESDYDIRPSVVDNTVDVTVNVSERGRNTIGFTGGVSGIGGGFLGINYETNNFLGFGETLAVSAQGGARQSNYMFSFTEPYLFDRPISTGFSIFSTEYRYDQARDLFGINPDDIPEGSTLENRLTYEQSRKGFSVFSSYPIALFQRIGVSFQLANSSTDAVNAATQQYFDGVRQFDDERFSQTDSFSDYRTRTITPSYNWNTVNNPSFPTRGMSISLSSQFTGGFLGGNVNYYRPIVEFRAFKPMNGGRNTFAFRVQASHISGFSGTSAPFYERFRLGGDFDVRGFDFQSLLPLAWVENRTQIGSVTVVSDNLAWVGGDTMAVANMEYRIPLAGYMFTLAPFLDVGNAWAFRKEQLQRNIMLEDGTIRPEPVRFVPGTNSGLRASTGLELQVMMPVINAPFRVMYYYNPLRLDRTAIGPAAGSEVLLRQDQRGFKFTVGRTF